MKDFDNPCYSEAMGPKGCRKRSVVEAPGLRFRL